jgi:lysophospholipase L1-like esterase
VQATTANQPQVAVGRTGLPAVRCNVNGTPQFVHRDDPVLNTSSGCTHLFVFDSYQPGVNYPVGLVESRPNGSGFWNLIQSAGETNLYYDNAVSATTNPNPDGMTVVVVRQLAGVTTYWINGVKVGTGSVPFSTQTLTGLAVGSAASYYVAGAGDGVAADWYLAAAFNVALTDTQVGTLNGPLVRRYVPPAVADPTADLIAWLGDSRTYGIGSNYSSGSLIHQTLSLIDRVNLRSANLAFPGTTATNGASAPGVATALASASAARRNNVAWVSWGINDLSQGGTASAIYANLKAIATALRAKGYKAVVPTVLPVSGYASGVQTQTTALNTSLRNQSGDFDAVADFAGSAVVAGGYLTQPTYSDDGLHPNAAGNAILAPIAKTALLSVMV